MLRLRNRVEVLIYDRKQNKVLVAEWVSPNGVIYVFPGGGIEENETAEEAAVKESLEEVGVKVEPTSVLHIGPINPIPDSDVAAQTIFRGDQTVYVAAEFKGRDFSKYNCEGDAMEFGWYPPLVAAGLVNKGADGIHRAQALRNLAFTGKVQL